MRNVLAQQEMLISDWLWLPLFLLLFVTIRRRARLVEPDDDVDV